MRILITGCCGFLGSHVCELFNNLGWEVIGLDNLTMFEMKRSGYKQNARYYNLHLLKKMGIKVLIQDLLNNEKLENIKVDYIVHTAAQPTMTLSISNPRYDLMNNIVATFNILELARKFDIPVSICSSVHVFGNNINKKLIAEEKRFTCIPETLNEDYKILDGEVSPLHASKASAEIYGQAFIDTYGLKVGIMRFTGMYGPRQFAGMNHGWVSNFIIRILKDLPIIIYGTDKQVRDILYATDAARIFDCFYKHQVPGLYVIGGGKNNIVSLREVIEIVCEIAHKKIEINMKKYRMGDLYYFVGDYTKANKLLGWKPHITPRKGLEKTIDWINKNIGLFEGIK